MYACIQHPFRHSDTSENSTWFSYLILYYVSKDSQQTLRGYSFKSRAVVIQAHHRSMNSYYTCGLLCSHKNMLYKYLLLQFYYFKLVAIIELRCLAKYSQQQAKLNVLRVSLKCLSILAQTQLSTILRILHINILANTHRYCFSSCSHLNSYGR